jgi:hypothetical protein
MSTDDHTDCVTWLCDVTGASRATPGARVQSLWSGYGEIRRYALEGSVVRSVVVKEVRPPGALPSHPRGWEGPRSHARKLRSYDVERAWYKTWAPPADARCRMPEAYAADRDERGWRFALEDLNAAGFTERTQAPNAAELHACLRWLAELHARFMGDAEEAANDLWPVGTYWHLQTRPDELKAMPAGPLRDGAVAIDSRLSAARFQTLVHGDAKFANFCFTPRNNGAALHEATVAAVDYQYVGGGCGMKDVAYFLSCLDEATLADDAEALVYLYYHALEDALGRLKPEVDAAAVEAEWRALYPFAWADFERFLAGWAPGHGKLTGYSAEQTRKALAAL